MRRSVFTNLLLFAVARLYVSVEALHAERDLQAQPDRVDNPPR